MNMGAKKTHMFCFPKWSEKSELALFRRAQLLELKYDIPEGVQSWKFIDHTNNFSLGEFQSYASRK